MHWPHNDRIDPGAEGRMTLTESIQVFAVIAGMALVAAWALWRFHLFDRDPERTAPDAAMNGILCPADGTVLYVKRVQADEAPVAVKQGRPVPLSKFVGRSGVRGPGYLVGIFMHPTSVHVNRAPIAGTVRATQHEPGSNLPMNITWIRVHLGLRPYENGATHLLSNERQFTLIANDRVWVCMVQIADYFVNRIECWVKEGEAVVQGQRVGRIRFGSQVDLFFPALHGLQLNAAVGQKVRAGIDLIAAFPAAAAIGDSG
jgi:phosphatidylserine decarboxylase